MSQSTVVGDLKATEQNCSVDPLPDTVVGKDGKVRSASRTPRDRSNQKVISARKEAATEREKERRRQAQRITATNAKHLKAAAANAPDGALNLPALRRARTVRSNLVGLAGLLPPERFVSQLPIEACREFSEDTIVWWQEVCRLAAERLATEGVALPPLPVRMNGNAEVAGR